MSNEHFREKIRQLDQQPIETQWSSEDLWRQVQHGLVEVEQKKANLAKKWWMSAAAMALAFLLTYLGLQDPNSDPTLLVTEEIAMFSLESWEYDAGLQEGKLFIEESCQKQLSVCESREFHGLYEELERIDLEKAALFEMVNHYGRDESVVKALIELENTESELISELITMILS